MSDLEIYLIENYLCLEWMLYRQLFLWFFKWLNLKIGSSFSISTAHVLASGWDQFVTNVLLLQGELHQVSSYFFREIAWKPNFSENCVFMKNLSQLYFSEYVGDVIGRNKIWPAYFTDFSLQFLRKLSSIFECSNYHLL